MKTIIAGCRGYEDSKLFMPMIEAGAEFLERETGLKIHHIASGMATGIDTLAIRWAKEHKLPVEYFPADWSRLGKKAGPIRNEEMAKWADALVLVWDGRTTGSRDMYMRSRRHDLMVMNVVYDAIRKTVKFQYLKPLETRSVSDGHDGENR